MNIDMSHVPNGTSGKWSITDFEVPPNAISERLSFLKTGRGVPPGKYKGLSRGGTMVMSNTPDEIRDFQHFTRKAHGNILINGLGLGVVITELLSKKDIQSITVIEASDDVIKLVAPSFNDPRLTIIHADAYTYQPPKNAAYDFVWHDIWDYICADNLPQMSRLHRKYGKRAKWQDSWAKHECQRQKSRRY
jgi:hypothetical protein